MLDKLKGVIPSNIYEWFDFTCVKYQINTRKKLTHFFSQVLHESGDFNFRTENLNYTREGLLKIFPKYFHEDNVMRYVKNPKAIANKVYSNRMGNGDEDSGDGWKYKGRGFIQLTGKNNYAKITKDLGVDFINSPELLITDKYACMSAGWFFSPIISKLDNMSVMDVTKYVNGGLNGLADREKKYLYLNKILSL